MEWHQSQEWLLVRGGIGAMDAKLSFVVALTTTFGVMLKHPLFVVGLHYNSFDVMQLHPLIVVGSTATPLM